VKPAGYILFGALCCVVLGYIGIAVFIGVGGLGSPRADPNYDREQFGPSQELLQFPAKVNVGTVYWLGSGLDVVPGVDLRSDPNSNWGAVTQGLDVDGSIRNVTVVTMASAKVVIPAGVVHGSRPLTGVFSHDSAPVRLYVADIAARSDDPAIRSLAIHDLQPIPTS
jgi:hypothetical protein